MYLYFKVSAKPHINAATAYLFVDNLKKEDNPKSVLSRKLVKSWSFKNFIVLIVLPTPIDLILEYE